MESKPFDYQAEANLTASNKFYGDKVPVALFREALRGAIDNLKLLDQIKKTLFYGRELPPAGVFVLNADYDCARLPALFMDMDDAKAIALIHSIVGVATEAGELLELLNNTLEGAPFDPVNFVEEVGDVQWYEAIGAQAIGTSFGEIQRRNIAKLRHRFPQNFTEYDANNRDLFGEREKLEALSNKPPKGFRRVMTDGEGNAIEFAAANGFVPLAPGEIAEES